MTPQWMRDATKSGKVGIEALPTEDMQKHAAMMTAKMIEVEEAPESLTGSTKFVNDGAVKAILDSSKDHWQIAPQPKVEPVPEIVYDLDAVGIVPEVVG